MSGAAGGAFLQFQRPLWSGPEAAGAEGCDAAHLMVVQRFKDERKKQKELTPPAQKQLEARRRALERLLDATARHCPAPVKGNGKGKGKDKKDESTGKGKAKAQKKANALSVRVNRLARREARSSAWRR